MKMSKKRSSASRKAYEGGYLTGKGTAREAVKGIQARKARGRDAMAEALKAARDARKR